MMCFHPNFLIIITILLQCTSLRHSSIVTKIQADIEKTGFIISVHTFLQQTIVLLCLDICIVESIEYNVIYRVTCAVIVLTLNNGKGREERPWKKNISKKEEQWEGGGLTGS